MSARCGQSRTGRVVVLALTATCCTALSAAAAGAASITEAQSEPTADPSTSVECPAGTHIISGGGQASNGGGGATALTESFKTRNGWRVSSYDSTSLIAYAYCTMHDYDLVTRKTDWVMTSDPLTVKCPSGTQIISGGGGIQNGENLGALSRLMRKRNGWIADASGIGPHSARAYCTAERLKLDWTTASNQPSPASAVCEAGVAYSGGGMASPDTGGLYEMRRTSANQWGVAGFSTDGLTAQVGCH